MDNAQRKMLGRRLAAGAAVTAALAVALPAHGAANAESACEPKPGVKQSKVPGTAPWAQQRFNLAEAWKSTKGKDIIVGVVDSGVDDKHPQLKGAVTKHANVTKSRDGDCVGHGTSVAGIIAARQHDDLPFAGVAPQAKLASVKFTDQDQDSDGHLRQPKAIKRAVDMGAQIINAGGTQSDSPALESAIKYALRTDVVVVAPVGNDAKASYPASYQGVIAVGASDRSGKAITPGQRGISVIAPGKEILSTWPRGTYTPGFEGSGAAAPFVAGTAALVRASNPELTAQEVKARIEKTADSPGGMVNPVRAVTGRPGPAAAKKAASESEDDSSPILALSLTGVAGAVLIAASIVIVLRRRQRVRP